MSWDSYITNMQAMPGVQEAAIFGHEGGISKWAGSPNFSITDDEVKTFCLSESAMRGKGVHVGGKKCILLRFEEDDKKMVTLQMKATKKDDTDKAFNATVYKTSKVVVICQGTPDATGAQVSSAATKYGEYLAGVGY